MPVKMVTLAAIIMLLLRRGRAHFLDKNPVSQTLRGPNIFLSLSKTGSKSTRGNFHTGLSERIAEHNFGKL